MILRTMGKPLREFKEVSVMTVFASSKDHPESGLENIVKSEEKLI